MANPEEQRLTADCEKIENSEPILRKDFVIDGAAGSAEEPTILNDDLPEGELNFPNGGTWAQGNSQQSTPPTTPKRSVVFPASDWMDQIDCNELKEKREAAKQARLSGGSYRATFQPSPNRQERYYVSEKL